MSKKRIKIVVLSDGETWEDLSPAAKVLSLTEEEYDLLMDGCKVRNIVDLTRRGERIR